MRSMTVADMEQLAAEQRARRASCFRTHLERRRKRAPGMKSWAVNSLSPPPSPLLHCQPDVTILGQHARETGYL